MNLDLLKKLTKLANHNPNDNEANLAARKVCKMLEAGKWELPNQQQKKPIIRSASNPSSPDDFIRKYYNEPKPTEPSEHARQEQQRKKYTNKGPWYDIDFNYIFKERKTDPFTGKPIKPLPVERELACKTCGDVNKTYFVGPAVMYQCYKCQFNEHNKKV